MDETRKTLAFVAAAVVVTAAAFLAAPADPTPEAFSDRGEAFFPDFVDPNDAVSLEVIDFDEATGGIVAFSVAFKGTRWRIPSHHNYPADDKDRLARTAAGLIEVRKDDVVAEIAADHEALGVVDPLDESIASLSGRGKRVTIKDGNDNLLADLIVGRNVPGREGQYRYLRVPGQKRTYAARFDVDVSSRFGDWIEKDLLEVDQARIDQVILKDYSIDEGTRMLNQRDTIVLSKGDADWTANRMRTGQQVDAVKMEDLLKALDELTIVGVRPKPAGLTRSLEDNDEGISITRGDLASLQQKGYYFTGDGQLVSNEGETQVRTEDGVLYTLRFGEIVYGAGDEVTAGLAGASSAGGLGGSGGPGGSGAGSPAGPGENRYLFITTGFDAGLFPEPSRPADLGFQARADSLWTNADRTNADLHEEHETWRQRVDTGRRTSADLNARFAQWYYVISAESFDRIRLRRTDLVTSE
ncbi:MAG: DUF4340 domain-containing protein [Gemmatimonadetes bacterium]|nr:DUF4340 domain-containing protein [Gemmatimonadota bacterium]MYD26605.1 DUF4340 domain-containing protein [Gemmatimonadota bacterium]